MVSQSTGTAKSMNGWLALFSELGERTRKPFGHATFGLYFLVGVFGFGATGVWYECGRWLNHHDDGASVLTALLTFFPALVGSTSLQIVIEEERNRRMRAFGYAYAFIFLVLLIAILWLRILTPVRLGLAGAASLGALWIWWIANADNPALQDEVDDEDALGGKVTKKAAGSLSGFKA